MRHNGTVRDARADESEPVGPRETGARETVDPGETGPRGTGTRKHSRPSGRTVTAMTSLLVMCALLLGGMFCHVPYVIEQPGPAIDVLGSYKDQRILTISGHEQYPTSGALMMTTVSVSGGPGYAVTPAEVVRAWFSPNESVLPREAVFPEGSTQQQTALTNSVDMTTSQQDAVAVALDELGIDYSTTVIVGGVLADGPAAGVLEAGDVIVSVEGTASKDPEVYQKLAAAVPVGQKVSMVVRRDGKKKTVQVPTRSENGQSRMGIVLSPGYDFPLDISVAVQDVGGPSAGTIFSLAVYDELTPGALTGGERIAGTGTIDADGAVGAIGGIRQKMVGARAEKAEFFLAPAANCDEVAGHVPEGLSVVRVSTFSEARSAVETIGRTHAAEGLPTCSS